MHKPGFDNPEQHILSVWENNALPWTRAVRAGAIASREQVTDRAILEVIEKRTPASVLDLGCGEGWLCRALARPGRRVMGVDATEALIQEARRAGGGEFHTLDYAQIADNALRERFDLAVCNFSLLGRDSVETLFMRIPRLLKPAGHFVMQTLHPASLEATADGWQTGSWQGCGDGFGKAAPWYFRSLCSWRELFARAGLGIRCEIAPAYPSTGTPASIIFVAASGPLA